MIKKFDGNYRWLSNFWEHPIEVGGKTYPSTEHYYQACKCFPMDDIGHDAIRTAGSPFEAKKLGLQALLRPDWGLVKEGVMLTALRAKFLKGTTLAAKLLETGDAPLVEGNHWHDQVYGVCHCSKCKNKGQNLLGKLLMQVRKELQNG